MLPSPCIQLRSISYWSSRIAVHGRKSRFGRRWRYLNIHSVMYPHQRIPRQPMPIIQHLIYCWGHSVPALRYDCRSRCRNSHTDNRFSTHLQEIRRLVFFSSKLMILILSPELKRFSDITMTWQASVLGYEFSLSDGSFRQDHLFPDASCTADGSIFVRNAFKFSS